MSSHVHVVAGESGAALVRAALDDLGIGDDVVGLRDPLNVGPLWDIEAGGAERTQFWRTVLQTDPDPDLGEALTWNQVVAANDVTVWCGQPPMEYLLPFRLAARLSRRTPFFKIVLRPRGRPHLAPFYDAINLSTSQELAQLVSTRTTVDDVDAMCTMWAAITASRLTFRQIDNGHLIELAEDGYDDLILSFCRNRWERAVAVVAHVIADTPIGDLVVAWRIRTLLQTGRLLGRGVGPFGAQEICGVH